MSRIGMFHISLIADTGRILAVKAFKTDMVLPEPGTIVVVKQRFYTPAGFTYNVGDTLKLIERTEDAPFGYKCSLGNWIVEDQHHTSIWSNIEWALIERTLEIQNEPMEIH